jgi:hypothetical protein
LILLLPLRSPLGFPKGNRGASPGGIIFGGVFHLPDLRCAAEQGSLKQQPISSVATQLSA